MKYMFVVQGEGRGHMTQALAIKDLLEGRGHEVCCVVIGTNKKRDIPDFFRSSFKCPVLTMSSPNFVFEKGKGVSTWKTLVVNAYSLPKYVVATERLRRKIRKFKPDVVLNFYEPLFGIYKLLGGRVKSFALGHQFMFLHPDYVANRSKEKGIEKFFSRIYTRLVGFKSKKLALSITNESPQKDIVVVPPILRNGVFTGTPSNEGFVLIYTLSKGYGQDFLMESPQNIKYEVFTEKFWPSNEDTMKFGNITFNKLDGNKFLSYMKRCEMVVCTAGFETASEASYLGKKVMVIPTGNHFEQYFNAWDFQLAGLARMKFDFRNICPDSVLPDAVAIENFQRWVNNYQAIYIKTLEL